MLRLIPYSTIFGPSVVGVAARLPTDVPESRGLANFQAAQWSRPGSGDWGGLPQRTPPTMSETEDEVGRFVIREGGPQGGAPAAVGILVLRERLGRECQVHHGVTR